MKKQNTRDTLLYIANDALKLGKPISVEGVAKMAGVSKATAYRYFASVDILKREASLHTKSREVKHLFNDLLPTDMEGRLQRLIDYHDELFTQNENEFRLYLGVVATESVAGKIKYNQGSQRVHLIEEAFGALRKKIPGRLFNHLVHSLSLIFGIESVIILKDLCHLNNEEIKKSWYWLSSQILKVAQEYNQ